MATVEAEFLLSAASPQQFPRGIEPEVALIGRSNVGKSSLINRLTGMSKLAYTSSRPGCTRTINFYRIGGSTPEFRLVDLPGYGFAEGPVEEKNAWKKLIEAYLLGREQLRLLVILLDSRRGWMDADREMRDWLEHQGRPYAIVATKIDKLNQKEYQRGMASIKSEMRSGDPVPFSAKDGRGVREIWQTITKKTTRP